jgi:ElaB/YqjD/DUF883 family membrane-anchored ribosome-binding protein
MNKAEHTFPIPETVAERLDKVEEELEHRRAHLKLHDYVKSNPWQVVSISALVGMVFGLCLRRCR